MKGMNKKVRGWSAVVIIVVLIIGANLVPFAELVQELIEDDVLEEVVEEIFEEEEEALSAEPYEESETDGSEQPVSEDMEGRQMEHAAGSAEENTQDETDNTDTDPGPVYDDTNMRMRSVKVVEIDISGDTGWSEEGYRVDDEELTIEGNSNEYEFIITGNTDSNYIVIPDGVSARVTLESVDMTARMQSPITLCEGAELELYISGENTMLSTGSTGWDTNPGMPAIYVPEGAVLYMDERTGGSSLSVTGDLGAAGIGGTLKDVRDAGMIEVNGGTIYAVGGENGTCIGGGSYGNGGEIIINDGVVTADNNKNGHGAAIGGGDHGAGGKITINGGVTEAIGGAYGAAIGGGNGNRDEKGAGGEITINGGIVTARSNGPYGTAIGGGYNANGGDIVINGGVVKAYGGTHGAAIGYDSGNTASAGTIYISKAAEVEAYGYGSNANTCAIRGEYIVKEDSAYLVHAHADTVFNYSEVTRINIYENKAQNTCLKRLDLPAGYRSYMYTAEEERTDIHIIADPETDEAEAYIAKLDNNIRIDTQQSVEIVPVKLLQWIISGTLWLEKDEPDGIMDASEPGIGGEEVEILKEDGDRFVLYQRAVTDQNGEYRVLVEEGNYKVRFTEARYYTFSHNDEETQGETGKHYADADGYSRKLQISQLSPSAVANAGFIAPEAEDYLKFGKVVRNPRSGAFENEVSINDPEEIIEYRLSFVMPENMTAYKRIRVEDIMPEGLKVIWGEAPVVYVSEGSSDTGMPYAELEQTTHSEPDDRTLFYEFEPEQTDPAFDYLAEKTITLVVRAQMEPGEHGRYLKEIVNEGNLFINGVDINTIMKYQAEDEGIPDYKDKEFKAKVTLEDIGIITGYVFQDMTGSGRYHADTDILLKGVEVELCDENGSPVPDGQKGKTVYTTGDDGLYRFYVPLNTGYMIRFPKELNRYGTLTGKGSESNASHADPDTGYSEPVRTDEENRKIIVNGGYYKAVPEGAAITKTIHGGSSYQTSDVNETFTYLIEAVMPKAMNGYTSIRIQDVLPAELELDARAADNVVVKVNGIGQKLTAANLVTEPAGSGTKVTYIAETGALSGESKITMELKVRLKNGQSSYPAEAIENEADLILNDDVITAISPTLYVKGKISGQAFLVTEAADRRSEGTGRPGITVELYEWGSASTSVPAVTTDSSGNYEFTVDMNKSYYVKFTDTTGSTAGLLTQGTLTDIDENHASPVNGTTEELRIDNSSKRLCVANAGYLQPDTDAIDLSKEIVDEKGNIADTVVITSKTQIVTYQLRFTLPEEMEGYESIILEDHMPEGLRLTDTVTESVKVLVDGAIYAGAEMISTTTGGKQVISAKFSHPDLAGMAEAEVVMEVMTKLDEKWAENRADDKTTLTNMAKLVVNKKPGEKTEIRGLLFLDKDGNGIYDAAKGERLFTSAELAKQADIPVNVYRKDSTGSVRIGGDQYTLAETIRTTDGTYSFRAETGEAYRIGFERVVEGLGLTMAKPPGTVNGSHAVTADGYTPQILVDKDGVKYEANAGYFMPITDEPENLEFAKAVLDEDGTECTQVTVSNPEQVLTYRLSFTLPSDMTGYQSIRVEDNLPAAFRPATGSAEQDIDIDPEALAGQKGIEWKKESGQYTMYYETADGYDFSRLAGQRVTMDVRVKLSDKLTSLEELRKEPIRNSGKLILNGEDDLIDSPDEREQPKAILKGEIVGTVFQDLDNDRKLSSHDRREEGEEVILLERQADGSYRKTDDMRTKADGSYRFVVELDGSEYKLSFPKQVDGNGLIEKGLDTDIIASHAFMSTAQTNEASAEAVLSKMSCVRNAGYAEPDTKDHLSFSKKVKDAEGNYHESVVLTDASQVLTYELKFVMPADVSGFFGLEISDTLPAGLVLANGAVHKDVKVYVNGTTPAVGDGVYGEDGRKVWYRFADTYDFTKLRNQIVTMEIYTKLDSSMSSYPERIVNEGTLIINEKTGGDGGGGGTTILPPGPVDPELPGAGDFTKTLINEAGEPVNELELRDTEQEVQYLITLRTGDLEGYETLEIRDDLDSRLIYLNAEVKLGGNTIAPELGTLSYSREDHRVSYVSAVPLDKNRLSGQVIELYLTVRLADGVTDYTNIGNIAELILNGGKEGGGNETTTDAGDNKEPQIKLPYGRIRGYVFIDEDGNGKRDSNHTPVRNAVVILERYEKGRWTEVAATLTDESGQYVFDKVEHGSYRIKVEHNLLNVKYTKQYTGTDGLNGIVSDANADGTVLFVIDQENKYPQPSAGLLRTHNNDTPDPSDSGGGKKEEDIFKKMPAEEELRAGEEADYVISGFGNAIGKDMESYSITDILPEGLNFRAMQLPAFTKGSGISYNVVYMTNRHSKNTKILHSGVPADTPFTVQAPTLSEGEWITEISVLIDRVPHGFGAGDRIVITCEVDDEPPTQTLINDAALGYNDIKVAAKTKALGTGGAPQTGDVGNIYPYTVLPVLALLVIVFVLRYERKRKTA